jgi:four helix bundle protein
MENRENVLKSKSFDFSLRIIKLYRHLNSELKEYVLSKQVLRSGTSIGANIVEANHAQSRADFAHKLSISLKEAHETQYWLELLCESGYVLGKQIDPLISECCELQRILTVSINTSKSKAAGAK